MMPRVGRRVELGVEAGQRLLHYRLAEKIGAGGMGVVWKAVDTDLDREVAIKILPEAFAADADRLARFEREGRLLASLNHPNVAAVYGLHTAETSAGDIRFIAMELVGGEDLSERLARGPMPPARALAAASQIAAGLSAAHEQGVIHRDLKPANIKLTPDGKVKVLDFGLAKAFEAGAASGEALTHSPTVTSAGTLLRQGSGGPTMAGVILGTAAYMSPEQARGRPVDRRTDLWAFGCVLFEMLTGRTPFPGEVITEIVARILEREPDWDLLPSPLHPRVRRLLERCLAKDPERRLRDAADARLEIEDLLVDPTGEQAAMDEAPAATIHAEAPPARSRWLPWAIVAALLIWALAATLLRPISPRERFVQFEINPPRGHQFAEFSTASDGSAVAFVAIGRDAVRSLWIRELDSTTPRRLDGTEGAWFPFWSPDGQTVAFFSRGKLRAIDVESETIRTIADAPNGRGGAWGHDGTILFTPAGADALYAVDASGGTPRQVTTPQESEVTHRFPHFVGDSRRFTYSAHDKDSARVLRRYLGSLDSEESVLLDDGMSETYAPPGYAFYVREETLYVQPLDVEQGTLVGSPTPLANDIDDTFPRTGRASFSVSDNGVLMYLAQPSVTSRIDAYDRRGQRLETIVPGDTYDKPRLSGDRRQLLFTRDSAIESTAWRLDLARGSASRLLLLPHPNINATWSADDRRILYAVEGGIYSLSLGGEPVELFDTDTAGEALNAVAELSASPDGRFLAFSAWDPVSDFDIWVMPLAGDPAPDRLGVATGVQGQPAVSPDSCSIAYESNESGRYEIYVTAVDSVTETGGARAEGCPVSTGTWLVSSGGGAGPLWNDDGTELYYVAADYGVMATSIAFRGGELRAGLPVRLFDGPLSVEDGADIFFRQPSLVGLDGDRFLFHVPDEEVRDRTIEVVLNWQRLL